MIKEEITEEYVESISLKTPKQSPQDVVRIYVPPAPVEDKYSPDDNLPRSGRSSIINVEYENPPVIVESPPKQKTFSPQEQQQRIQQLFDEESQNYPSFTTINSDYNNGVQANGTRQTPQQYYYYPTPSAMPAPVPQQPSIVSTSSRRGSLSRKSPSPLRDIDVVIECEHMRQKRTLSSCSNGNAPKIVSTSDFSEPRPIKRMTSFEELAQGKQGENIIVYTSPSKERYEDSDRGQDEIIEERIVYKRKNSKPKSDYNIQYRNFQNAEDLDDYNDFPVVRKSTSSHGYNVKNSGSRKHSSSDNSPFDYDLLKEKRKEDRYMAFGEREGKTSTIDDSIKSYNRFFNDEDDEDEEDFEVGHHHKFVTKKPASAVGKYTRTITGNEADEETDDNGRVLIRKSSDDENDDENSSNSPPSNPKSILNTPINETIPLLMGDPQDGEHSHSIKKISKIPRYNRSNSNNSSFNKHSSISSPDEDDRSEKYYSKKESSFVQSTARSSWNKHDGRLAQSFGGVTYQSYSNSTPPSSLQSRHSNVRRSTGSAGPIVTNIPSPRIREKNEANKIRIKINQKN